MAAKKRRLRILCRHVPARPSLWLHRAVHANTSEWFIIN
jgi:hypothetical protein